MKFRVKDIAKIAYQIKKIQYNRVKSFLYPSRSEKVKDNLEYIVDDNRKIVYLIISKNACSSIKASFIDDRPSNEKDIHHKMTLDGYRKIDLTDEQKNYFKFTFVRNPFDRLISTYINKYTQEVQEAEKIEYKEYLEGYLINVKDFDDYVKKVCLIPRFMMERHILPQHLYI